MSQLAAAISSQITSDDFESWGAVPKCCGLRQAALRFASDPLGSYLMSWKLNGYL